MNHRAEFHDFARYAKRRALARGLFFNLNATDLWRIWVEQGGACFWTGLELDFKVGRARHPLRPSVDRLFPYNGYVRGNVVWSSNFANRARGDLPPLDFAELMCTLGFPSRTEDERLSVFHNKKNDLCGSTLITTASLSIPSPRSLTGPMSPGTATRSSPGPGASPSIFNAAPCRQTE